MPRRVHEEDSRVIEGAVRQHPDGLTAQQIDDALQSAPPRRTLQYRLKSLVTSKRLVMEGTGSHRRTAAGTEAAPLWLRIESRRCSSSCSAGCPGRDRERQRAHGGPSGSCPASGRGPACSTSAAGPVPRRWCWRSARSRIVAVDNHPPFIHILNREAQRLGVANRLEARVADMRRLDFADDSFDLICEQAGSARGGHAPTRVKAPTGAGCSTRARAALKAGLRDWRRLLRPNGHVALTEVCWRKPDPPAECVAFWKRESAGTPPGDDLRDGAGCAPGRVALVDGAETQLNRASAAVDLTVW